MLAVSLDGRLAPPGGGAAQLGGPGDRLALEESLAWADGALIGAETLRRHGSTCLIRAPALLAGRARAGRSAQPAALVVSRSGRLPPDLPFWRQPLQRWWLRPHGTQAQRPAHCQRMLAFSSWPQLRAELAAEGLERLLLLGGADLAGQLLADDQVDELQLTLCPLLLGGPHTWMPPSLSPSSQRWRLLEQRCLGGDELLLRYRRAAAPALRSPLRSPRIAPVKGDAEALGHLLQRQSLQALGRQPQQPGDAALGDPLSLYTQLPLQQLRQHGKALAAGIGFPHQAAAGAGGQLAARALQLGDQLGDITSEPIHAGLADAGRQLGTHQVQHRSHQPGPCRGGLQRRGQCHSKQESRTGMAHGRHGLGRGG